MRMAEWFFNDDLFSIRLARALPSRIARGNSANSVDPGQDKAALKSMKVNINLKS